MKAKLPSAALLMAEDIRMEVGGKTSLLGFFPGSIIIGDAAGREVTEAEPVVLRLAYMVILTDFPSAPEKFKCSIELVSPHGKAEKMLDQVIENPGPGRSATFALSVMGARFAVPGVRYVRVILEGQAFDLPYEVRFTNVAEGKSVGTRTRERSPASARKPQLAKSKNSTTKTAATKEGTPKKRTTSRS